MDLNKPFIGGHTLAQVCKALEENDMVVAQTGRALGVRPGTLSCKIMLRKNLAFFQQRYPGRFSADLKPKTPYRYADEYKLVKHTVKCMVDGCENDVVVELMPGEQVPRGLRKRCYYHNQIVGQIEAGCICTGGGEVDQLVTW